VNELAHFLYAVDDKSQEALKLFEKARLDGLSIVEEAYIGGIKALTDLGRAGDAKKMLKAARRALGSTSKLARLQDEIDFPASTKKSQHARG